MPPERPSTTPGKAVLQHIVAKPQHAGFPGFLFLFGDRNHLARRAVPAIIPADPFRERDLLLEHRHLPGQRAVGVEHEGRAVEDELVLAAHLVQVDHGQPRFGHARDDEVEPHVVLVALEGRAVGNEQDFGTRLRQRLAGLIRPDILADRNAEPHTLEGDGPRCRACVEHALLIENAVIRQVELVAEGFDAAIGEESHGIIEVLPLAPGKAHQHGGSCDRIFGQFLHRCLAGRHEGGPEHQVLRRIAADEELGKQDQVRLRRLDAGFPRAREIGVDGAERGVELGQRDDESVGHGGGLSGWRPCLQLRGVDGAGAMREDCRA
jgi:hypothetical protein